MAVGPPAGQRGAARGRRRPARRVPRAPARGHPVAVAPVPDSPATYDVVVAGLGGFGSSAAAHLAAARPARPRPRPATRRARRGRQPRRVAHRAAGLLRGRVVRAAAAARRSSCGPTCVRRQATRSCAPPARSSWARPAPGCSPAASRPRRQWDLEHEVLDSAEVAARFPAMRPPEGTPGALRAGRRPGRTRGRGGRAPAARGRGRCRAAPRRGGDRSWSADGDGVRVRTSRGDVAAGALVLAPGRWTPPLLGDLSLPLVAERRVQHWYAAAGRRLPSPRAGCRSGSGTCAGGTSPVRRARADRRAGQGRGALQRRPAGRRLDRRTRSPTRWPG